VVHVGLDSTRSNAVHRDLLVTHICSCQLRAEKTLLSDTYQLPCIG
jgi:hypothetical protein